MAVGTLPDSDEEKKLNPNESDQTFRNTFGVDKGTQDAENFANDEKNHATGGTDQNKSLGDLEGDASPINSTFTGKNTKPGGGARASALKSIFTGSAMKKGGPAAVIIGLIVAIFGIGGTMSSLFLVNFAEVMTNKFDTALGSMDTESSRIFNQKLQGMTSGICAGKVSFGCKYSKFNKDEIAGMEKHGITFKDADSKTISADDLNSGKVRPKFMSFNGEDFQASDFTKHYTGDANFRSAFQSAVKYNAKYATFTGKAWQKIKGALGVSKQDPFEDEKSNATDEDRLKTIQSDVNEGEDVNKLPAVGDDDPRCNGQCTEDDVKGLQNASNELSEVTDGAESSGVAAAEDAATTEAKVAGSVAKGALAEAANYVKLSGTMDTACTIYNMSRDVGYAAKMVRYAKLARYALIFLTVADMIKAGDAKGDDVNYLANTLTSTISVTDSQGNTSQQSATDSLAYRNAAFGDTGTLDTVATNYLTAAGFTGALIGVTNTINTVLGGSPKTTCKVLANPFVQLGSFIGGVAAAIFTGGVEITAKDIAQAGMSAVLVTASILLPTLLKNIISGNIIDKTTQGAAAGDAVVSGSGALMSTSAQYNGSAPMTPDQAVAYTDLQNQTLAMYNAEDEATYGPLDATHSGTFLGSIVTQLSRYATNFASVSNAVSSLGSIFTTSFGSILSTATHADNTTQQYETCQDDDYKTLGIATDLFCNPVRGIPPQYLDNAPSPADLFNQLVASGDVDADTGDPISSAYTKFISNCIERSPDKPLGDDTNGADGGADCIITNQNTANWYIYYMNNNILYGMENGMDAS